MKIWIPMILLLFSVTALCVWDYSYTDKIFNKLKADSYNIHQSILSSSIEDNNIKQDIISLNEFWTKKMDTLSISISRKDLQPISDYLQYLYSASLNNNQEDAITYSTLLYYNVIGITETNGLSLINLL